MALTNFSLPSFGSLPTQPWAATISPIQPHHASAVNNLLYGPAGHQESDEPPAGISHQEYYKNSPYSPPANYQFRSKPNNYLPPHQQQPSQQPQLRQQTIDQQSASGGSYNQPRPNYLPPTQSTRTYGEGNYGGHVSTRGPNQGNQQQYFNGYNTPTRVYNQQPVGPTDAPQPGLSVNSNNIPREHGTAPAGQDNIQGDDGYPERPPGFTRVQAGRGSRTQVHAVLDYDADETDEADYYDEHNGNGSRHAGDDPKSNPNVTPIQGPIFLKNGTAPVVPLFAYPTMNNGTFVQIPCLIKIEMS
ncbi:unnamed protein product [Hermetia illucens]|uniref:Uncharacterized protein n=1 Tax=Hermetia illucens TaxID=343691 RepID=A0A7R8UG09_HERIL|nr:unnamed protein product [Hermetia illucens]